ncbi:MAG: hypothetical protein ACLVL7_07580 [Anaerotruncus massiliensis (ex Togo et al. 2019)]
MEKLAEGIATLNQLVSGFVWGRMIGFLLLAGLYFTVGTGFHRRFGLWLRGTLFAIFHPADVRDRRVGAISRFRRSPPLAGTIGTGNIVGVARSQRAGRGPSSGCGSPRSSA